MAVDEASTADVPSDVKMRLAGIFEDHTTEGQFIPLGDLSVILGANDTGKSRLLGGVRKALSDTKSLDPSENESVVYFEITDFEFEHLVMSRHRQLLGIEADQDVIIANLFRQGVRNSPDVQEALAQSDPKSARELVLALALGIDAPPDLADLAEKLQVSRLIGVVPETRKLHGQTETTMATWLCVEPSASDPFPQPGVTLGMDPTIAEAIPETVGLPQDWVEVDEGLMRTLTGLLEAMETFPGDGSSEDDEGITSAAELRRKWMITDENRLSIQINPKAFAVCFLAGEAANAALPDFINQSYRIVLLPVGIDEWDPLPSISLEIQNRFGDKFFIGAISEGLKLWIQLALLEGIAAVDRLAEIFRRKSVALLIPDLFKEDADPGVRKVVSLWDRLTSDGGDHYDLASELVAGLDQLRLRTDNSWPTSQKSPSQTLYVIDEPERHLHPRLARQAAKWLEQFVSRRLGQGLIATHSAPFLSLGGNTRYLYAWRDGEKTGVDPFEPEELAAMDHMAEEIGFDRGELLSSIRVLLFVEGRADQIVLERLYRTQLHAAGIEVIPVHGVFKFQGVIEAEALWKYTSAKIAILVDNDIGSVANELKHDSTKRYEATRQRYNTELQQIANLLETAVQAERDVEVHSISAFDMFGLLDEDMLKKRFKAFPGHEQAEAEWEERNRKTTPSIQRKPFFREAYGVDFYTGLFEDVASEMLEQEIRPSELTKIVNALSPDF